MYLYQVLRWVVESQWDRQLRQFFPPLARSHALRGNACCLQLVGEMQVERVRLLRLVSLREFARSHALRGNACCLQLAGGMQVERVGLLRLVFLQECQSTLSRSLFSLAPN